LCCANFFKWLRNINNECFTVKCGINYSQEKEIKKKQKRVAREDFVLNDYLKEILVGLLLGDLYGRKKGDYTLFTFKQGLTHQDYLNHLYSIFKDYSAPKGCT
jgi:hypothetical protein